jgi:transposase
VRRNLYWLSDEQWKRIEPHLPTDALKAPASKRNEGTQVKSFMASLHLGGDMFKIDTPEIRRNLRQFP